MTSVPAHSRTDLLARYCEAKRALDEASRAYNAAHRARYTLALALMELEGRGTSPSADWIRAHLAGDHERAAEIRADYPHSYCDDEPREIVAAD